MIASIAILIDLEPISDFLLSVDPARSQGLYQIGEVSARSCVIVAVPWPWSDTTRRLWCAVYGLAASRPRNGVKSRLQDSSILELSAKPHEFGSCQY